MSIIQNIRERGTWILLGLIALALIAFILQDGVGRNNSNNDLTTLGKVNGQKIDKIEFEQKVQNQLQQSAAQGAQAQRGQVVNNEWNKEVFSILIKQESEKIGLSVGTKEINDVLFGVESPFKQFQQFVDPATGELKVNELKTTLAELKKSTKKEVVEQRDQIEKNVILPAIEQRAQRKYQVLLYRGIQTPKWLIEKQYAENNAISNIRFVNIPYTTVEDKSIKVTNEDITAYLKENSESFQIEELQRNINFVAFSAAPTATDTAATRNNILALKEGFQTTTDVASFLNKNTPDARYYNGYLGKNRIQIPEKDAVLNTPIGGLYGPYIDGPNLTIAKVIGTKLLPDTASVRHILIGTVNGQNQITRDDSVAKKLIDSIKNAIAGGASFETLVEKYSDDGSKTNGGKIENFPQATMVKEFNDFSFENPVGTKGIVKTEYGYHYVEVLKQTALNPAYNIAYLTLPITASKETTTTAQTTAAKFAADSKDQKSFNANALKLNKQAVPATGIRAYDFGVQGLGETREVVRWVFDKKINDVSEPIEVGDAYIVATITGEDKPGLMSIETAKANNVEVIIKDQKKAAVIKTKLKGATLEAIATAANATVLQADSLSFATTNIAGLGNEPKIVGAAFNKNLLNKVSEPIAGNAGVFVISVSNQGSTPAPVDIAAFKNQYQGRVSNNILNSVIALKKKAKIEDNRAKLY
jgi:peptidyl-prolyl cis-trans isomerase D